MPKINWLTVYLLHWKTGGFLSLGITFAQGHLWAHIQDLKCSAGFWISKRFQQHVIIHISSLQGSSVYLFFFSFWDPVFIWKDTEPGSLWLTRLLAEACSPFVKHVFQCGPRLSLGGFFLGRLPVGARCHAEPKDLRHCNLPALASLNAKQHGVGQCWLSVQPGSLVKRANTPRPHSWPSRNVEPARRHGDVAVCEFK